MMNDELEKQAREGKPCIGFSMENAMEAYRHMEDRELIRDYGDTCGKNLLYTWDAGHRTLVRCKKCGGYILVQISEFHGMEDDMYYADYFPVSGQKEAELLNQRYDGETIETEFPGRWLICEGGPHWSSMKRMVLD